MNAQDTALTRLPLQAARRTVSAAALVAAGDISGGQTRLRMFTPAVSAVDLPAWFAGHRAEVEAALRTHGGVLFRGFQGQLDELFPRFVKVAIPEIQPYIEGATPRTRLADGVYTSTEFPEDQTIAQHNELSYVNHWPMRICFACKVAAEQGGATPLTDVRQVLANLEPALVRRFAELGWMLIRNYGNGLGPDWRKAFNTDDIGQVKRYCADAGIELEIFDEERIRTRQVRKAIRIHPVTGEAVWFNHVAFWHPSSLHEPLRRGLQSQFAHDQLPYTTCWGDGTQIDDDIVGHINDAYRKVTLSTPWQPSDIMLLDNMLIAHGREPFKGQRAVVVAMGQAFDDTTVEK
jgi:alpha-ketoglutarate-dependent taurine dioxygenase